MAQTAHFFSPPPLIVSAPPRPADPIRPGRAKYCLRGCCAGDRGFGSGTRLALHADGDAPVTHLTSISHCIVKDVQPPEAIWIGAVEVLQLSGVDPAHGEGVRQPAVVGRLVSAANDGARGGQRGLAGFAERKVDRAGRRIAPTSDISSTSFAPCGPYRRHPRLAGTHG